MMMAACYANYDISLSNSLPSQHAHHLHQEQQHSRISSVAEILAAASSAIGSQKDYTVPLHVDCSVEYELPNQAKPPAGQRIEPLLMIHPCYFRKMESQRRSPFINNMPNSSRSNTILLTSSNSSSSRRLTRQTQAITIPSAPSQQQQQREQSHPIQQYHSQSLHSVHSQSHIINQQIQQQQISQQAHYPVISTLQHHQQPISSTPSSNYADRTARRVSIIQSRSSNQYQQQQQQQQPKIPQWDKIASTSIGVVSSLPQPSALGISSVATINLTGKSIYTKPVGKRDAMISGECSNSSNCNNTNNINNRNSFSNQNNNSIKINNSANCTSLIDSTNLRMWDSSSSLIIHRSPMAAVPSNYQAGPETTSTSVINNAYSSSSNSRNETEKNSGKYRQHLRSHRIHPYLIASANNLGSSFPQISSSAVTSFPQMQQMSCYNV